MKSFAAFVLILLAVNLVAQDKTKMGPADAIFINGNIWTGTTVASPVTTVPRAQALAVKGDRVVAIGTNEEVKKLKDAKTTVVDLGGRFVMPGFNDAHLHLSGGGFEKMQVDLVGTKSLAEMKQRIAEHARTAAAGEWLLGRGWDHTKWTEQVLPTRQDLDSVTGNHPAIFGRIDGHISVANSAALKLAGIDRNTKAPNGGKIDIDAQGEPTGILRESAVALVGARIPHPTPSQCARRWRSRWLKPRDGVSPVFRARCSITASGRTFWSAKIFSGKGN
jgi:predicted amidohydrolase YtcJ